MQVLHVAINPGKTYTYTLPIPQNLSPGNYWYHPHLIGNSETNIQVCLYLEQQASDL